MGHKVAVVIAKELHGHGFPRCDALHRVVAKESVEKLYCLDVIDQTRMVLWESENQDPVLDAICYAARR